MSQFAQQLKNEISRIARKEIRSATGQVKKASSSSRTEIAALKKRIASLEAQIKRLARGASSSKKAVEVDGDTEPNLRFRAGGFATLRKKLGLSAADMGKLLGVSLQSVYHWETGKSKPRARQLAAIAAVRKMGKKAVAAKLAEPEAS